jgi:chemotaxis protein histidine kinase CheA
MNATTTDFDPDSDEAAIAAAEAVLAELAAEYPAYAAADLADLETAFDALWQLFEEAPGEIEAPSAIHAVFEVAHNMKGQGASFGYDLITTIAGSLCAETRDRQRACLADAERWGAHLAALSAVLEDRLTGEGGPEGEALIASLGIAVPSGH